MVKPMDLMTPAIENTLVILTDHRRRGKPCRGTHRESQCPGVNQEAEGEGEL